MPKTREPKRPISLAGLMRIARTTYVLAVRAALAKGGFDDVPRDGVFAMSAINRSDVSARDLGHMLGVSKQSVSQLLDTLVLRGYVERSVDPSDRRRMRLKLTERGARVQALCRDAVDRVERRIVKIVGGASVEHTRATLTALVEMATELEPEAQPVEGR